MRSKKKSRREFHRKLAIRKEQKARHRYREALERDRREHKAKSRLVGFELKEIKP
jgi:hypothetical protein